MTQTRRIVFLAYEGFELLDVAGPSSVFNTANQLSGSALYDLRTVSVGGGLIRSGANIEIQTQSHRSLRIGGRDTVLVMGAEESDLRRAIRDEKMKLWLRSVATRAQRFGSICTGTFILGAAGLLDDRRAATHWAGAERLARLNPRLELDVDALYVEDDSLWTSAGATTGIDMSLALLERDRGSGLSKAVAQRLVVFMHRPGHQSQFSAPLAAQKTSDSWLSELIPWIEAHLHESITVQQLADQVHMSERSFHRRFRQQLGVTPARYVEQAKLNRARLLLEDGESVSTVASEIGYRSQAGFRTAFEARFGLAPSVYRTMHSSHPS